MQRRSFLKQAGLAAGGAVVAAPVFAQDAPAINWRLASSFGPALDILFGAGEVFCKYVGEATGGKFRIRQSAAGEIAPALGVFDAVSAATVECGHSFSAFYIAKEAAFSFDTAVPFGLNARQMNAWMFDGDGLKLTRDLFKPHKILNLPLGNTGVQMGGWYRKAIKSPADLKGLKMQVSGLGGDVLARLGVVPQDLAAADLRPALEKGELDALSLIGPYDDEKQNLGHHAWYYYYPGWWQGGPQASLYMNEDAWGKLPKRYQAAIESASRAAHMAVLTRYDAQNPAALRRLIAGGAQVRPFPRSVLDDAYDAALQMYQSFCAQNPRFKAVHDPYMAFRDDVFPWFRIESSYEQYLGVRRT
ncbi:twin-arginine translocation signal domain-containing protein [Bordetella avium]|uniref:twin-arginine translocation signal domain-containing protein n=1 Tax=Bordetella avium TaxID=521 RepID=UPI000E68E17A|nr:twin-arginine translocation signal domain-containing protein [Bordetella avium]RIQ19681.1 twin-arginine translocation signal domain-containing protein [Bordetella avium]RIQ34261.1 twin-arginine translocation signal domain-containing protein [Bordetella avium]